MKSFYRYHQTCHEHHPKLPDLSLYAPTLDLPAPLRPHANVGTKFSVSHIAVHTLPRAVDHWRSAPIFLSHPTSWCPVDYEDGNVLDECPLRPCLPFATLLTHSRELDSLKRYRLRRR